MIFHCHCHCHCHNKFCINKLKLNELSLKKSRLIVDAVIYLYVHWVSAVQIVPKIIPNMAQLINMHWSWLKCPTVLINMHCDLCCIQSVQHMRTVAIRPTLAHLICTYKVIYIHCYRMIQLILSNICLLYSVLYHSQVCIQIYLLCVSLSHN